MRTSLLSLVQAPTIYRLFGDKRGLLDAVVAHGIAVYTQSKAIHAPIADPVEDLRVGFDQHIEFGLANPAVYALMSDPSLHLTAAKRGAQYLEQRIHGIALAGRLRVSEARAVELVHAVGLGTVLALLERPEAERDLALAADARDALVAAITTNAQAPKANRVSTAAIALRAGLAELTELSPRERDLLDEWRARIAKRR
jgi:AcrR family transcriptional regulator